jgi:tRNA A-37 threonylcarbamoyl transferase component Bud32
MADATISVHHVSFVPPTVAELAGKFPQLDILELIGSGGMGAVYKARQKALDRLVALKILPPDVSRDPSFAERFVREAKVLAKLNHPNIVTLYEFGETEGLYYFLMEYVEGVNLRQLLGAGKIPPKEALAIVPPICDALQFAHDRGIVHRDIKPENILLNKDGQVKIADFGVAKIIGSDAASDPSVRADPSGVSVEVTEAGSVIGTPHYMAPEQHDHPGEVDHRADIYSLGVVFYQMLTGELPAQKLEAPSKKIQIDVRLDEVVLRALDKNPERRYQHASDVKTMVQTVAGTLAAGTAPVVVHEPPRCSRAAIVGACWAPFFVLALIGIFTIKIGPISHSFNSNVPFPWWQMVLSFVLLTAGLIALVAATVIKSLRRQRKAILIMVAAGALFIIAMFGGFSIRMETDGHAVSWWQVLFIYTLATLCVSAPFGTTILGWVGVAQIRRAAGRLYGLELAVLDGLLFPLLALDVLIAAGFIIAFILTKQEPPILLLLALVALVDILIVRGAWKAVTLSRNRRFDAAGANVPSERPTVEALCRWGHLDRLAYPVFGVLYLAGVALLLGSSDALPERVATHFGFNGQPDGWMSRRAYLAFEYGFPALIAGLFAGLSALVRMLPAWCINIPRKDYWLAPERRALTGRLLRNRMGWLLCLLTLFFAGLHVLTVQANRAVPPQLPMGGLLLLVIAFFVGLMIWMALLLMRFAEADAAGSSEPPLSTTKPGSATPKPRSWRKGAIQLVIAVAFALAIKVWVLGNYRVNGNALAPEIPGGSYVLAWKPASTFRPGDLIVYRDKGRILGGRVERSDAAGLVVNRNGVTAERIARKTVCGRIITVLWRSSGPASKTN